MQQMLYTLLGAFIAILGSFLTQRYQVSLAQQQEDERLLFQALRLLRNLRALITDTDVRDGSLSRLLEQKRRDVVIPDELAGIAIRIKSSEYRGLAVKITMLALDPPFRTDENLENTVRQLEGTINKSMIDEYEREVKKFTQKFIKQSKRPGAK